MRDCEENGVIHRINEQDNGFNLSRHLRLDTQISIARKMTVGNRSNKDASVYLSSFGWRFSVLVQQ